MPRLLLWSLFALALSCAHAADLGHFTIPDNHLPWTRAANLDGQFGGQVIRVTEPRGAEMLVILPLEGTEAPPSAVMATILGELRRVDPAASLGDSLQLGFGEGTWFGVGRTEGGHVMYRGATCKGRLVYPVALRLPAPGTVSDAQRQFLRNLKIQRVVTRSSAAALMSRGNLLLNKKDLPGALAAFNEAVAKDPQSPEVHYFRGMCHKRMKDFAAARTDLDRALTLKRTADFLAERAEVESAAGNHAAALDWLQQALAEEPENDAVHRNLGLVHYSLGRTDRAIAAYERALELNPANRGGRASLVKLHSAARAPAAAAAHLQAFRQFHPGDAYADELQRDVLRENPGATFAAPTRPAAGLAADSRHTGAAAPAARPAPPAASAPQPAAPRPGAKDGTVRADDDPAALAAFKQLPPLPPLSTMLAQARANPVAPRLDPREFNSLQYLGAVAAVRQAMEHLAGPLDDEARAAFDARWAAIEDYPADACVEYLNAASPLLGEILALRAVLAKTMQGYDNLLDQARTARLCDNHAAAHEAMRRAGQHAALLKGLQRRCDLAVQELAALGEPPDATEIKARVAAQFAAAKSLLRDLDRPLALAGEYEPAPYETVQDPFGAGPGRSPDPAALKIEYDEETGRSVFYQPLKSLGGNRVLMYVCETFPRGNKSSWTQVFEEQGGGVFVSYGGGSELSRTVIKLDEDGFTRTEYSLGPPGFSGENDDFSERTAAAVAKGQRPPGQLVCSVRTLAYHATGVQHQNPPTDDEFDWRGWEGDFRKREKQVLAGFEGERRAFEALAPGLPFPQPVRAEHVFWVLERAESINQHPTGNHRVQLQVENPRVDAEFQQMMRRAGSTDPRPLLISERRTEVRSLGITHEETRRVLDDSKAGRPVHDSLTLGYEIAWTPPSSVIAQAGGRFATEFTATRTLVPPKIAGLLPAPMPDVFASAVIGMHDAAGAYLGSGGDGAKAGLLSRHTRAAAPRASQGTALEFALHGLSGDRAAITLRVASTEAASLAGAGVTYHYRRRVMTPDEAAALAESLGDRRAAAAPALASTPRAKPAAPADTARAAAERQARADAIAFHESTILYEQKRAQQYQQDIEALQAEIRKGGPPSADQQRRLAALQFNLLNAQSNALAGQDNVHQLKTGRHRRTETPFDVMARAQLRRNIEDNIRRLEAVETEQELAAKYLEFLPAGERPKALDALQKIRDEAPDDLARYRQLNAALKNKWRGQAESRLAALDEDLAWKEAQVAAIENVKTGADTGLMVCSMVGGPQAVALTYQFATGWAEKDLLTGVKQSLSAYSDAVDTAWSTYDGYCRGGWAGAAQAGGVSLLLNQGTPYLLGRMSRGGGRGEAAAPGPGAPSRPAGTTAGPAGAAPSPRARGDDIARYEGELRAAEAQIKGFQGDYHAWRQAVHDGAPEAEVRRLHERVLAATAQLNGNPAAKGFLKYKAPPAVGRLYEQTLEQIHARVRSDYYAAMKAAGYGDHEIVSIRNAASSGSTGMDYDQALKEQPDWIPAKQADGSTALRRNLWLTKSGQPVSRHQWQLDAQKAWNDAYRRATGGSAPQAWEKLTTRVDPEAYRLMEVLGIRKDLANIDEIMENLDPRWVRQLSDVTLFKAGEMLNDKSLSRLAGVREACRGTAKDLEGKFLPFIDAKLAALRKIPAAQLTASDRHNLTRLESARERFAKVQESFAAIGRADLPPSRWDDSVALATGGKGIIETIQDLSDLTESLFK